jgi:hypothetical protein
MRTQQRKQKSTGSEVSQRPTVRAELPFRIPFRQGDTVILNALGRKVLRTHPTKPDYNSKFPAEERKANAGLVTQSEQPGSRLIRVKFRDEPFLSDGQMYSVDFFELWYGANTNQRREWGVED